MFVCMHVHVCIIVYVCVYVFLYSVHICLSTGWSFCLSASLYSILLPDSQSVLLYLCIYVVFLTVCLSICLSASLSPSPRHRLSRKAISERSPQGVKQRVSD